MNQMQERIKTLTGEMLDVAETIVTRMKHPPARTPAPVGVERRALANTLHLFEFCPQRKCRRTHCCRGEPKDCLRIALPLLPPEMIESLMKPSTRRRR